MYTYKEATVKLNTVIKNVAGPVKWPFLIDSVDNIRVR